MNELLSGEDPRCGRGRSLECAVLLAVGLVGFQLATHFPSHAGPQAEPSAWREKDWFFWYNAHQLFRRDPEQLSASELDDVRHWCECSRLADRCVKQGSDSLTDDERRLVVETLEDLCPNLEEHLYFLPVYQACCRLLVSAESNRQTSPAPEALYY
jgi:hypothetical protein